MSLSDPFSARRAAEMAYDLVGETGTPEVIEEIETADADLLRAVLLEVLLRARIFKHLLADMDKELAHALIAQHPEVNAHNLVAVCERSLPRGRSLALGVSEAIPTPREAFPRESA